MANLAAPHDAVPDAVRAVLETLDAAGHPSFLVGGCVRDLLTGRPAADYDVATPAAPETLLTLFPRAIPIGLRHGTVMLPTEAGPVDITAFRAAGGIEADLAHRDFTLNAIALDPLRGRIVDPSDGRGDLTKGLLRAVGQAEDRIAEDPLRALRAARFAATLELDVDPALQRAMPTARAALADVARERVRHEVQALLLGTRVDAGLALLKQTGLEREIATGAADDAPQVVAALPAQLVPRMAAWLRGARIPAVMRGLRFPRRGARLIEHLLRNHPVDDHADPARDASVRRLMRSVGDEHVDTLVALRRAELEHGAGAGSPQALASLDRLAEIEAAVARARRAGDLALRRRDLALSGEDVMRVLGRGPGPQIGRALRHLTERVLEQPDLNTPERLRELLRAMPEGSHRKS